MKNVEFCYMYRDGANYKASGGVVFTNPDNLCMEEADERIRKAMTLDNNFIASQAGVDEVFLWDRNYEYNEEEDHCWHEFCDVYETTEEAYDERTFLEFVKELEAIGAEGWKPFDVAERIG